MKQLRLDKLLSNMGVGSRTFVKDVIKKGQVSVNDKICLNPQEKVKPGEDRIFFCGKEISYREFIYVMLNKPQGIVSSTDDPRDSVVVELLDNDLRQFRPFPVGRLDKDTEGLLLLTNDGELAHKLLSPKNEVDKEYFAIVEGELKKEHVEIFTKGIKLEDGYITKPAKLEIIASGNHSKANITIVEGKYHQIKRMFASQGFRVTYLKRFRMGKLNLSETLGPGEYRELTEYEVELLKNDQGVI